MESLLAKLPEPLARSARWANKRSNVLMFVVGFLFDVATIKRIDAWLDIAFQLFDLTAVTILLVYQYREVRGYWKPTGFVERWWPHNVEVLHFFYGALLSNYVILYFKSSTGAWPLVFFCFLVALMFVNEMPQIRRAGHRLRLGLYAFCVLSFMNFFVPILIGRMGGWVFALALLLSALVVWRVADWLAAREEDRPQERARLFVPAAAVFALIGGLYVFRLIPPVPMSVQYQGVFHEIRKKGGQYTLVYERQPVYAFWRHDDRPYRFRDGDRLCFFARIYAPARFRHQVILKLEYRDADAKTWAISDRIPFNVLGGRAEGYRGVAIKENFSPGRWRAITETEDGRALSIMTFDVVRDPSSRDRRWRTSHA